MSDPRPPLSRPPDDRELSDRLARDRPVPATAFRSTLRPRLAAFGWPRHRPARLRALVAAHAGAGAGLLLLGALSVAGAGPLGL